jgi:hypothetical protein
LKEKRYERKDEKQMKIRWEKNPYDVTGLIFPQRAKKHRGDKKGKNQCSAGQEDKDIAIDQIEKPLQDHTRV